MRKFLMGLAVLAIVAAACSPEEDTPPAASASAGQDACGAENLTLVSPSQLTVGTDFGFMFPPWILKNDPTSGKGFESAVAYEVAERLGFARSDVEWIDVPFNRSYAPGPKDFDFDINNISVTEERDQAVDFSDGYYDLTQALMVLQGSPIENATTMDEIKDSVFGAQIGTTSLEFISTVIQPAQQAKVYDTTNDAKAALRNGQVDGLVLDLPTAYFEANINTPNGALVGQFPSTGEHLGMLFEEGNPLRDCVNDVLAEMESAGTLQQLQNKWLSDYLNVPVIE
ncbi:MAG: ABC transporter substrate-binding protein [Actinomycetota bacterium]